MLRIWFLWVKRFVASSPASSLAGWEKPQWIRCYALKYEQKVCSAKVPKSQKIPHFLIEHWAHSPETCVVHVNFLSICPVWICLLILVLTSPTRFVKISFFFLFFSALYVLAYFIWVSGLRLRGLMSEKKVDCAQVCMCLEGEGDLIHFYKFFNFFFVKRFPLRCFWLCFRLIRFLRKFISVCFV